MRGQLKKLLIVVLTVTVVVTSLPSTFQEVQAAETAVNRDFLLEESVSYGDAEIQDGDFEADGDEKNIIHVDEDAIATYQATATIAVSSYQTTADPAKVAAQQKAWDLINNYADPEYFLDDPYLYYMTDAEYAVLKEAAQNAIAGCRTQ